jgi:antibiotic biosynthesis monooxygenase (ABM) superfamily enzyme
MTGRDRVLVAVITIRAAELEAFRAFEWHAARVMAKHGGRIERTVVIPGDGETLREVHVVRFPDDAALAAYRADADLGPAMDLRERSVVATELLMGEDGPDYSAADASAPA